MKSSIEILTSFPDEFMFECQMSMSKEEYIWWFKGTSFFVPIVSNKKLPLHYNGKNYVAVSADAPYGLIILPKGNTVDAILIHRTEIELIKEHPIRLEDTIYGWAYVH